MEKSRIFYIKGICCSAFKNKSRFEKSDVYLVLKYLNISYLNGYNNA